MFYIADAVGHGAGVEASEVWSMGSLVALVTLTSLEIVLGIDNVIFIAILSGRLPKEQQKRAQKLGIGAAVLTRVLLLMAVSWLMGLTEPLWSGGPWVLKDVTGKGLILILGGLFLVGKSVFELHEKLEAAEDGPGSVKAVAKGIVGVVAQIMLIDVVFSLDSVITAMGMSDQLAVMILAVLIAAGVMMMFAASVSDFVERHPTMKVLALAFLLLIGVMLFAEGFGHHIPKGYIYFAMAFSLGVEMVNMRVRGKSEKVHLHYSTLPRDAE
jgi:predicted tellurium resistance membrane protein TerC